VHPSPAELSCSISTKWQDFLHFALNLPREISR
jgi:hypothetical protein